MTGVGRSPAAVQAHSVLRTSALGILSSTGFRKSSANAADLLTEVLQRYISLLAESSVASAERACRTQVVPRDIAFALESVGSSLEEVRAWIDVEAPEEKELARAAGTRAKAAALKEFLEASRPAAPENRPALTYAYVGDALESHTHDRDSGSSDAESELDDLFVDDGQGSTASSATSHEVEVPREYAQLLAALPLIPSHLPPLPSASTSPHLPALNDSRSPRLSPKGKARLIESEEAGPDVRKVIRDVWKESVPFDRSRLRERLRNAALDLPSIDRSISLPEPPQASSLHAFAADFVALQQERTSSARAGILMTPEGTQSAQTLLKRRRMASALADPARFTPLDSLHAAVSVKPSAVPFNPSPSLLITLPADGSAPVFTPTNPLGRSVCLVPPSGAAAQPVLSYRWPVQVQAAVRSVAEIDIQRKVARIDDPPPLYDSQHVERVFRGMPASRQLLSAAHSALAPALNALAVQQKRKLGAESDDADLELPTKGTLVYTWDWTTKDPFDDTLPGKRVRVEDRRPPPGLQRPTQEPAAASTSRDSPTGPQGGDQGARSADTNPPGSAAPVSTSTSAST